VLCPLAVDLFFHLAVGLVCSHLYEGIFYDCLRCPRLCADPANLLGVSLADKFWHFVLAEGQESCIPTVPGYMVQWRETNDGVKSVAGSPISVPVACDVSMLG
jgi:hypothetical protein